MAISRENRDFVNNLIDYYVSESRSYRQIAEGIAEARSVPDTAFGIIAGCVYSGFMQACQSQGQPPTLEEMQEFGGMLKERAAAIRESVLLPDGPAAGPRDRPGPATV